MAEEPAWKKAEDVSPKEPSFPEARPTIQYKEPVGPVRRKSWLSARKEELVKGAKAVPGELKKGVRQVGESIKESGRRVVEEDIYRQPRPRAQRQAPLRRPRRSRAPVPGGRAKRPWIPSRRAPAPSADMDDLVSGLVSHGGEFLDMGVADVGIDLGSMLGGGPGFDVNDIMNMGTDLLYGPRNRVSRRKHKKKKR